MDMKKLIVTISILFAAGAALLFFIIPPTPQSQDGSPYVCSTKNQDKKKILILSSRGGGGHISAMKALEQYLSDDYCVGHAFIFSDILGSLDPATKRGEEWYNFFIRRKWYQVTSMAYYVGSWYYRIRKRTVVKLLENYLTHHRPDLIISVIPLVNDLVLQVAKKLNIPFLLIPTDLDTIIALNGIYKPQYDKFYLGLSYNDSAIEQTMKENQIDEKYISYVGFPVKKTFFEPVSARSIKKEFGIPQDKPVILLLMGAQGSNELLEFSRQLSRIDTPAHIIIALGKSENLRKSLQHIKFPKHITTTILGFTDRMQELIKLSDIFITKSGSVSVNEGIYAHVPILLDGTSSVLKWEQFNHDFIEKNGFGEVIHRSYEIPHIVKKILTNKEYQRSIKQHYAEFEKNNPEYEIPLLVRKILSN